MLNEKERLFVEYWERNRDREKRFIVQLLTGLPIGLLFALPIVFILLTGKYWFKRADMVANSQMSISVLVIAVLLIAGFVGVFYKSHKWEMKNQQYKQLKAKESR